MTDHILFPSELQQMTLTQGLNMQADIKFKCVTTAPSAGGVQQLSARLIILHSWYQQGCFYTTAADLLGNFCITRNYSRLR